MYGRGLFTNVSVKGKITEFAESNLVLWRIS